MKKRLLSAIMSLCMVVSLLPVSAFAADESGMVFNKRYDAESGTLTLEAWATGKEVTIPGTSTPLDIVLVLDQSGSMEDDFGRGTRQEAMKEAVTNFVDQVADNARDNRVEHQIGIVTFGDDAETLVKLQDAEENRDSIKWSVNRLPERPEGATRVDQGMDEAADMLAGARKDSKKVVIVFTDGVPTTSNAFSVSVANSALKTALEMKQDDTTIYTVGIFEGADPDELYGKDHALWGSCDGNVGSYWSAGSALFWGDVEQADVPAGNRFLNYLSSKYEASEIGLDRGGFDILLVAYTSYEITRNFNPVSDEDYYLTAADADGLTDAFEKIEDSIGSQPVNAALDERTQIVDEISPYFEISEDADAVKVYTVNYTGSGWAAEKGEAEGVDVTVEDGTVTVSGYDFAANYVSSTPHDGGYGQKLVIEIQIAPDQNPEPSETEAIPTNGDAEVNLEGTTIETAETPTVTGVALTYDDGAVEATGGMPETGYYVSGVSATVSNEKPTGEKVVFLGWSTEQKEVLEAAPTDDLYTGGETIAMNGAHTLFAVWAKDSDGDGTPDYDEIPELEDFDFTKKPVTWPSSLLLTKLDNSTEQLISGEDFMKVTGDETSGYQGYTTKDTDYVMYEVRVVSTEPGTVTVSDEDAEYVGATLGDSAEQTTIAENEDGTYTVTFDETTSNENAANVSLYFQQEVDLSKETEKVVSNTATANGKEAPSGNVTVTKAEAYDVTYEWADNGDKPYSSVAPLPKDENRYEAGSEVKVSDKYHVGSTVTGGSAKYIFYGWEVTSPEDVTIETDNTFIMPASDVTITGTWKAEHGIDKDKNYITVQVVNGTAACETADFNITDSISHFEAAEGQGYTITFTPETGYKLDTVIVDGTESSLTDGKTYTFDADGKDHGIVVYFVEDPGYEPIPELDFDDLNYGVKEVVTSSYVALTDPDERFSDYTAAVEQDDGTYTASTTEDSITLLYQVRLSSKTAGAITVRDEGAVYVGAKLGTGTTVEDNDDGSYTVTFGESAQWANLYFTVTINNIPAGGTVTAGNTAVIGEEEVKGDDVTVIQGDTYRVTYVWGSSHPEMEGYKNPPVDPTLYREGDVVTVDDTYYVGESVFFNDGRRYIFLGWEVQSPADSVTINENNQFEMPAEDVILVGNWQFIDEDNKDRPYITVKVVNGSAVFENADYYYVENGVKTFQVTKGNDYTINFTPDDGYTLGTVMVNGEWLNDQQLTNGVYSYEFHNIDADHGIVVYFVEDTNEYTLTYDGNGTNVTNVPAPETVKAGTHDLSTIVPIREGYGFIGWSTTKDSTIYKAGQQLPETTETVKMEKDTTVYAVWGEDTNGDEVADATQVLITPAKITIYEGGEGYDYALGDADQDIAGQPSSGLPEPGYYIVLPYEVNEELKKVPGVVVNDKGYVNLADHLTFSYNDEDDSRVWELTTYDPDGLTHLEDGRYIYRILPATADTNGDGVEESIPVRLVFTDEDEKETISDDFTFSANDLYAKFQMTIYDGGLDQAQIQATVDGTAEAQDVGVGTGELVIRGTTGEAETVKVNDTENDAAGFTVTADTGNVYYVNGSPIQVQESDIRLLADDLAMTDDAETALQNAADDAIETALTNPQYEFKYLDLVDYNNGNAYVTLNQDHEGDVVTIHWPMPANADPDTIHVVHFDGMDREFNIDQLNDYLDRAYEIKSVDVNGDVVSFNTSTFSPFVLVYETKAEQPDPTPDPDPGNGNSGSDNDNDSDPTGNLSIELDVNGGDDDFTFTVILTDRNGDDLENNFYYNGDYTGTIGSGDEITLEGGEKIVIRNLPEGTRYEVIIETADGYTYVIDGEEGVIHTGMNEAEFTATRTVPVADPSVTGVSRWLNTTDHIAYLTGYPGGTFGPDNNMTRAEVAQMFYALLNNKNVTITKTFPDVPADAWYATAVNTLASLGMVSGDENGNYRPDDPITRAEFCVIALAFAYEPENAVCYFGDVSRSDWFYTYVAQAASYGWIGGYTNGNFGPNDRITRAQVTTIVNNMLGRAADRDYVIDHQADLVQFSDLTRAHWGYFQIMEATNAHDYTKSNGTENWR